MGEGVKMYQECAGFMTSPKNRKEMGGGGEGGKWGGLDLSSEEKVRIRYNS